MKKVRRFIFFYFGLPVFCLFGSYIVIANPYNIFNNFQFLFIPLVVIGISSPIAFTIIKKSSH